jgi:hypothetical protein
VACTGLEYWLVALSIALSTGSEFAGELKYYLGVAVSCGTAT